MIITLHLILQLICLLARCKKFNGSQYAPQSLSQNGDQSSKYSGVTRFVPMPLSYVPCETLVPQEESYNVFVEDLYKDVNFSNPSESELYGTNLYRYYLDKVDYGQNYKGNISCLVQKMDDIYSFPSWISNPHFFGCETHPYLPKANPSITSHLSTIDIEPRTGQIWRKHFRLQTNTYLRSEFITTRNKALFNISLLDALLPVYWIERRSEITKEESDYFKEKVCKLLDASCGGLVGFTVIAILTVITSVFVTFLPHGRNKVAPAPVTDDEHAIHPTAIP